MVWPWIKLIAFGFTVLMEGISRVNVTDEFRVPRAPRTTTYPAIQMKWNPCVYVERPFLLAINSPNCTL